MSLSAVEEVPSTAVVLRIVPTTNIFIPEGAPYPTGEAFNPSTDEKADAVKTGNPVRVSVWDRSRTTVKQAVGFRGRTDVRAYSLDVAQIEALRDKFQRASLRVVRDPDPALLGPGADGHCGIEGLVRINGEPRPVVRDLLHELSKLLVDASDR